MLYNALVREYSGQTLQVVARVLLADFKDFTLDWRIRYNGKDVDRNSTLLSNLCCSQNNPIQLYKPEYASFPITVRTIEGESFQVMISASNTVKVLKLKIFQQLPSYPPHVQQLYFTGLPDKKKCSDDCLMDDYSVKHGSTVWLKKHSSIFDYQWEIQPWAIDLGKTFLVREKLWMRYSVGVSIGGTCTNPSCASKADGQKRDVLSPTLSLGCFSFDMVNPMGTLDCTICSHVPSLSKDTDTPINERWSILPNSLLVFDARVRILFKPNLDKASVVTEALINGDRQHPVTIQLQEELQAAKVEMTVVEPWNSPYVCVRCDTKIMFKKHEKLLKCGHIYHTWCSPSFMGVNDCCACESTIVIIGKMDAFVDALTS